MAGIGHLAGCPIKSVVITLSTQETGREDRAHPIRWSHGGNGRLRDHLAPHTGVCSLLSPVCSLHIYCALSISTFPVCYLFSLSPCVLPFLPVSLCALSPCLTVCSLYLLPVSLCALSISLSPSLYLLQLPMLS
jgi:hypothetical protein